MEISSNSGSSAESSAEILPVEYRHYDSIGRLIRHASTDGQAVRLTSDEANARGVDKFTGMLDGAPSFKLAALRPVGEDVAPVAEDGSGSSTAAGEIAVSLSSLDAATVTQPSLEASSFKVKSPEVAFEKDADQSDDQNETALDSQTDTEREEEVSEAVEDPEVKDPEPVAEAETETKEEAAAVSGSASGSGARSSSKPSGRKGPRPIAFLTQPTIEVPGAVEGLINVDVDASMIIASNIPLYQPKPVLLKIKEEYTESTHLGTRWVLAEKGPPEARYRPLAKDEGVALEEEHYRELYPDAKVHTFWSREKRPEEKPKSEVSTMQTTPQSTARVRNPYPWNFYVAPDSTVAGEVLPEWESEYTKLPSLKVPAGPDRLLDPKTGIEYVEDPSEPKALEVQPRYFSEGSVKTANTVTVLGRDYDVDALPTVDEVKQYGPLVRCSRCNGLTVGEVPGWPTCTCTHTAALRLKNSIDSVFGRCGVCQGVTADSIRQLGFTFRHRSHKAAKTVIHPDGTEKLEEREMRLPAIVQVPATNEKGFVEIEVELCDCTNEREVPYLTTPIERAEKALLHGELQFDLVKPAFITIGEGENQKRYVARAIERNNEIMPDIGSAPTTITGGCLAVKDEITIQENPKWFPTDDRETAVEAALPKAELAKLGIHVGHTREQTDIRRRPVYLQSTKTPYTRLYGCELFAIDSARCNEGFVLTPAPEDVAGTPGTGVYNWAKNLFSTGKKIAVPELAELLETTATITDLLSGAKFVRLSEEYAAHQTSGTLYKMRFAAPEAPHGFGVSVDPKLAHLSRPWGQPTGKVPRPFGEEDSYVAEQHTKVLPQFRQVRVNPEFQGINKGAAAVHAMLNGTTFHEHVPHDLIQAGLPFEHVAGSDCSATYDSQSNVSGMYGTTGATATATAVSSKRPSTVVAPEDMSNNFIPPPTPYLSHRAFVAHGAHGPFILQEVH